MSTGDDAAKYVRRQPGDSGTVWGDVIVTTNVSAAAIRLRKPGAIAALMISGCIGLAACSANNDLISAPSGTATLAQQNQQPGQAAQPQATAQRRLAMAPIVGAPDSVKNNLTNQLKSALGARGVDVDTSPGATADMTLRGYIVAARERSGAKVSYIWDVTDPSGNRLKRLTGEEVVAGINSRDAWSAVSNDVVNKIASRTANELGAWLPSQPARTQVPQGSIAAPTNTAAPTPVAARTPAQPTAAANTQVASNTNATRTTTGSIPRPAITVVQPNITGAPGDGRSSLSTALARELTQNGVGLTPAPRAGAYRVDGRVAMGAPVGGKQSIQIDWVVKDPQGGDIGTVTQKNQIAAGSLDGAWGSTADAAAGAAAQGVLRLLKEKGVANN